MIKTYSILVLFNLCVFATFGQKLTLNNQEFELKNVTGSITELKRRKGFEN